MALRAAKVKQGCLQPNKRGRHERVCLKELIKKSEENYIDFQCDPWRKDGLFAQSIATYGSVPTLSE